MTSLIEGSNYTRLCGLLVDTGQSVLKDLLEKRLTLMYNYCHKTKHNQCGSDCSNESVEGDHCSFTEILAKVKKDLLPMKQMRKKQRRLLYPENKPNAELEVDDLDVSLTCLLLKSICGMAHFDSDLWKKKSTGVSQEECIARLHHRRDYLLGHVFRPTITRETFDDLWACISMDLHRLSKIYTQEYYDLLKMKPIDPVTHEQYIEEIRHWRDPGIHIPKCALDWNRVVPVALFIISLASAFATYKSKHIQSMFEVSGNSIKLRLFELNELSIFFNIVASGFGFLVIPYYCGIRTFFVRICLVLLAFVFFRIVCAASMILMINYVTSLSSKQRYLLGTIVLAVILFFINDHYEIIGLDFL